MKQYLKPLQLKKYPEPRVDTNTCSFCIYTTWIPLPQSLDYLRWGVLASYIKGDY